MISLFIRQISNLSTISICLPRNGAHDESRCLAKADCYMLWSGSLVGETKYKLCAIPLPRTISSCDPFQPLPICLCTRVFCFDPWMCARSAQRAHRFWYKKRSSKPSSPWLSRTDTGRLSSASIDEVTLTNYVGGHLMDRLSMCKQPCHLLNNHFKRAKNHNWFRSGRLEKKYIIWYIYSIILPSARSSKPLVEFWSFQFQISNLVWAQAFSQKFEGRFS